ncbi:MAG: hypothetical protein EKK69_08110 [Candidatus Competibacteraceae bacterium]|nr:MAG: hypothetical protein EKK69_08110 [Candidatus Competibacteraceae bacterium]
MIGGHGLPGIGVVTDIQIDAGACQTQAVIEHGGAGNGDHCFGWGIAVVVAGRGQHQEQYQQGQIEKGADVHRYNLHLHARDRHG